MVVRVGGHLIRENAQGHEVLRPKLLAAFLYKRTRSRDMRNVDVRVTSFRYSPSEYVLLSGVCEVCCITPDSLPHMKDHVYFQRSSVAQTLLTSASFAIRAALSSMLLLFDMA